LTQTLRFQIAQGLGRGADLPIALGVAQVQLAAKFFGQLGPGECGSLTQKVAGQFEVFGLREPLLD
jgi:hypothetical protein